MLPFVRLHEGIKYGEYASNTAMDGFSNSTAAVMIVHSRDDETVPPEYGYDIYYKKYKDDSRFRFIQFEEKGHNYFHDETYRSGFNSEFDKWLETLDYDYKASEYKERFSEEKAAYIHQNLDREKWCGTLDSDLFEEFVGFYDENLENS